MRLLAALAFAALTLTGIASPVRAGLLELPFDEVSRDRHCDAMPCRSNNLHRLHTFVRDRYLRFDIHSHPARYALRRVRVMIAAPGIVVDEPGRWDWLNRDGLVAYPVGPHHVVEPPKYMWVTENVLVSPARNYVTRRHPYYAYYPQDIYVTQP